jgi:hypothetical protein
VEYYLAIKKKAIVSFVEKWMELKIHMLSTISQAQKEKHTACFLLYAVCRPKKII